MWEKEISCPLECICRLEHLTEMAIYRYMQPEKQYHHTSEANILENNDVSFIHFFTIFTAKISHVPTHY